MMKKMIGTACAMLLAAGMLQAQNKYEQYKTVAPAALLDNKELTANDLQGIHHYYQFTLKDTVKATELENLLIQREPHGSFARGIAFHKATSINQSVAEQAAGAEQFLQQFPEKEWNHNPAGQGFMYYTVHRMLGTRYFETRKLDKLLKMTSQLDFRTVNEIYRWNITRGYMFKLMGYDTLYKVATPLIKHLIATQKDGSYTEAGVFTPEKALVQAREQLDHQLDIQIKLLDAMGKNAEAKAYFNELSAKAMYASADLNEVHINVLEKLGDKKGVLTVLEKSVEKNAVTPGMFTRLKKLYAASHANDMSGYEKYLSSLQSEETKALMLEEVKSHMTNMEFEPFAVKNPKGELVRSSDWEDRIVVIDFWATWCKPCIEAFPGMQMLIDKYAKDSSVAIYFMGTMQFGDYKEKSENYIKEKGYHGFNLLHDNVVAETGEQNGVFRHFAKMFNSSGIPRKIVVKDGLMRYTSEGYSGSPSQLADELSLVIELLKAEK